MYEQLTPRQKEILIPFLANKEDGEIAAMLHCTTANVRFHLSRIFRVFDLVDSKGDRCRHDLVDLFVAYRSGLVDPGRSAEAGYRPSIAPVRPDIPGRPMPLGSPFYVQPTFEARCCEEVLVPGQLIRIRAPQTTGKTSLLNRILHHAETEGYPTLRLNLHYDLDETDLTNLATFLQWFCRNIAEKLNLPVDALPSTKQGCSNYFKTQVLPQIDLPFVIALDEAEALFEYPALAREFFGLLRGWHEKAKEPIVGAIWEKLRLVVVHSTDDYIGLNVAQSPFKNVGHVERLKPLTAEQIYTLVQQYGLPWSMTEVNQLMTLVGGHPFLVQQALYSVWCNETKFTEFLTNAPTLAGIYRTHLQTLSNRLQATIGANQIGLREALVQVIQSPDTARLSQEQLFKLEGLGVVQLQANQVRVSCELYRQFFQNWL